MALPLTVFKHAKYPIKLRLAHLLVQETLAMSMQNIISIDQYKTKSYILG